MNVIWYSSLIVYQQKYIYIGPVSKTSSYVSFREDFSLKYNKCPNCHHAQLTLK